MINLFTLQCCIPKFSCIKVTENTTIQNNNFYKSIDECELLIDEIETETHNIQINNSQIKLKESSYHLKNGVLQRKIQYTQNNYNSNVNLISIEHTIVIENNDFYIPKILQNNNFHQQLIKK